MFCDCTGCVNTATEGAETVGVIVGPVVTGPVVGPCVVVCFLVAFELFFFLLSSSFIPTGMFGTIKTKDKKMATNIEAAIITGIDVGRKPPVSPKILKIGGLEISKIETYIRKMITIVLTMSKKILIEVK